MSSDCINTPCHLNKITSHHSLNHHYLAKNMWRWSCHQGMEAGSLWFSRLKLILGYLYLSSSEFHSFHHSTLLLIQSLGLLRIRIQVMTYLTPKYQHEDGHLNKWYRLPHPLKHFNPYQWSGDCIWTGTGWVPLTSTNYGGSTRMHWNNFLPGNAC